MAGMLLVTASLVIIIGIALMVVAVMLVRPDKPRTGPFKRTRWESDTLTVMGILVVLFGAWLVSEAMRMGALR